MKVLLTGAAGFIGSAVAAALRAEGAEVVPVDVMLPMAHGSSSPPEGTHRLDVRDADSWRHLIRGVDAVVHEAAVVGAGVRVADLPLYAAHNDLGTAALLAAMHEEGVDRLVLASSMVVYGEGRYRCADHGTVPAPPRRVEDLEAGRFEVACPVCGAPLSWALVPEDAPLDPRSGYAASTRCSAATLARATSSTWTKSRTCPPSSKICGGSPRSSELRKIAATPEYGVSRGIPGP